MVARQPRAELVDGAEGPTSEPPGHATPPPSFLSWAYPMPRRIAMRFAMGGWVASASAKRPSCPVRRRPSGSVMQRWAAPRLMAAVGATAPSIFWSAPASASGLRVNCALMASARYSRLRLTATARSEEHTSELQSQSNLVCRLLLEKKNEMDTTSVIAVI